MRMTLALLMFVTIGAAPADDDTNGPHWANDFEAIEIGEEPEDGLVLEGTFTVQSEGEKNKALHLPGAPLGTFGILLGPSERSDVSMTARIRSERKGRRYPAFGVGLCGNSGYRLQVTPGRDEIELLLGDDAVKRVAYEWKSGVWTRLRLEVRTAGEAKWIVRGRAWADGANEPDTWAIEHETETKPRKGGASLWGLPYSSQPVWFDDVIYAPVATQPTP